MSVFSPVTPASMVTERKEVERRTGGQEESVAQGDNAGEAVRMATSRPHS